MKVYVAFFKADFFEEEKPRVFSSKEKAEEFCEKENRAAWQTWTHRMAIAGVLTYDEYIESGTDLWVVEACEVEE